MIRFGHYADLLVATGVKHFEYEAILIMYGFAWFVGNEISIISNFSVN